MSNPHPLTIDQQIVVNKFISETHRKQFDQRRNYEWRVFYSTLGVYASILAGKYTDQLEFPKGNCTFTVLFILIASAIAISSIVYLNFVNKANKINKECAHIAENALMDLLPQNELYSKWRIDADNCSKTLWSLIWQTTIIVLFSLATILIILFL